MPRVAPSSNSVVSLLIVRIDRGLALHRDICRLAIRAFHQTNLRPSAARVAEDLSHCDADTPESPSSNFPFRAARFKNIQRDVGVVAAFHVHLDRAAQFGGALRDRQRQRRAQLLAQIEPELRQLDRNIAAEIPRMQLLGHLDVAAQTSRAAASVVTFSPR